MKKFLLSILIVTSLFTFTGCGKKTTGDPLLDSAIEEIEVALKEDEEAAKKQANSLKKSNKKSNMLNNIELSVKELFFTSYSRNVFGDSGEKNYLIINFDTSDNSKTILDESSVELDFIGINNGEEKIIKSYDSRTIYNCVLKAFGEHGELIIPRLANTNEFMLSLPIDWDGYESFRLDFRSTDYWDRKKILDTASFTINSKDIEKIDKSALVKTKFDSIQKELNNVKDATNESFIIEPLSFEYNEQSYSFKAKVKNYTNLPANGCDVSLSLLDSNGNVISLYNKSNDPKFEQLLPGEETEIEWTDSNKEILKNNTDGKFVVEFGFMGSVNRVYLDSIYMNYNL